jgi:general secretion pathway protein E/type IV pilus assembly protein PilB
MVPMRQYGIAKALAGITTLQEVMTVTAASE